MRTILFLLFFFTLNAWSQRISVNEIDEFTNTKKIKSDASAGKKWKQSDDVAEGLFNILFISSEYHENSEHSFLIITLDFQVTGLICLADNSEAILLLENKETISIKNTANTNCEHNRIFGRYSFSKEKTAQIDLLTKLSQNPIDKIRIYTTEGYLNFTIKKDKKEIIQNHFELLKATILQ